MNLRIGLLGGGSWGTTVGALVARNTSVTLWARDSARVDEINEQHTNSKFLPDAKLPESLMATTDIEEAVAGADVIVVGIPSQGFRNVIEHIKGHIRPWVPVVSLSKGLELDTHMRMTEIIEDVLPGHPAGVLTGPNLAREIMAGYAAASVIAIAAGMGDGQGAGENTRSAVITRGLAEITRLGVAMGGEPQTFAGLTGMGDLVATCTSAQSRNRTVGFELGKGRSIKEIIDEMFMVAEGVKSAPTVMALAEEYGVEMPIAAEVYEVVQNACDSKRAFRGLLRSTAGAESDPG